METIRNIITNSPARSAWDKGVKQYALELIEEIHELPASESELKSACLNGADNWEHYSWSGCSLCYDIDICYRVCSPSEIKKRHEGDYRPNNHEEWLDVQARALHQAYWLVKKAYRKAVTANA